MARQKVAPAKTEPQPRGQCELYIARHGGKSTLVSKTEFDKYTKGKNFRDGPFRESFGDGPGEPYNPRRQAFGTLENGKVVYCELSIKPKNQTK